MGKRYIIEEDTSGGGWMWFMLFIFIMIMASGGK